MPSHPIVFEALNFKSRHLWLGLLAGIVVSAIAVQLRLICWAPFLAVPVALALARIQGVRQGAIVGTIVVLPYAAWLAVGMQTEIAYDIPRTISNVLMQVLTIALVILGPGALYGAVVGGIFGAMKAKNLTS